MIFAIFLPVSQDFPAISRVQPKMPMIFCRAIVPPNKIPLSHDFPVMFSHDFSHHFRQLFQNFPVIVPSFFAIVPEIVPEVSQDFSHQNGPKWRALGAALCARSVTLARPRWTTRGLCRLCGLCTTREAETTVRAGSRDHLGKVVKIVLEIITSCGYYMDIMVCLRISVIIRIFYLNLRGGLFCGFWCKSDKYMSLWWVNFHSATWCNIDHVYMCVYVCIYMYMYCIYIYINTFIYVYIYIFGHIWALPNIKWVLLKMVDPEVTMVVSLSSQGLWLMKPPFHKQTYYMYHSFIHISIWHISIHGLSIMVQHRSYCYLYGLCNWWTHGFWFLNFWLVEI